MARTSRRFIRTAAKALPVALGAAAVYFIFIKPKTARALTTGATRPASPAGRVPDVVETVSRLPTTPAGVVPGQLTPAGRSADIVARIRAGLPVNG